MRTGPPSLSSTQIVDELRATPKLPSLKSASGKLGADTRTIVWGPPGAPTSVGVGDDLRRDQVNAAASLASNHEHLAEADMAGLWW